MYIVRSTKNLVFCRSLDIVKISAFKRTNEALSGGSRGGVPPWPKNASLNGKKQGISLHRRFLFPKSKHSKNLQVYTQKIKNEQPAPPHNPTPALTLAMRWHVSSARSLPVWYMPKSKALCQGLRAQGQSPRLGPQGTASRPIVHTAAAKLRARVSVFRCRCFVVVQALRPRARSFAPTQAMCSVLVCAP